MQLTIMLPSPNASIVLLLGKYATIGVLGSGGDWGGGDGSDGAGNGTAWSGQSPPC